MAPGFGTLIYPNNMKSPSQLIVAWVYNEYIAKLSLGALFFQGILCAIRHKLNKIIIIFNNIIARRRPFQDNQ
jgi:hypothetical protein